MDTLDKALDSLLKTIDQETEPQGFFQEMMKLFERMPTENSVLAKLFKWEEERRTA